MFRGKGVWLGAGVSGVRGWRQRQCRWQDSTTCYVGNVCTVCEPVWALEKLQTLCVTLGLLCLARLATAQHCKYIS